MLKLSRAFAASLNAGPVVGARIQSAFNLVAYLKHEMAPLGRETFRVLFLDGENRLLDDRVLWTGTPNAVQVHPREIVHAVLDVGATAIIAAHNHPSGSPRPSRQDLMVTGHLLRLCRALEIAVQDHVIVARSGVHSMRSMGDLASLEAALDMEAVDGRNRS